VACGRGGGTEDGHVACGGSGALRGEERLRRGGGCARRVHWGLAMREMMVTRMR
jgi:hypothetical protein